MNCWWRSSCAAVPSSSGASESGAATFVVTTNNDTIILQPAEDSISNTCSIGVTPTTRFGLQTSPVRFTKTFIYKANQPERNSRLLVVRLILTLVRFASLSVRTDLWGPLVASLLVEKTKRTLLDIKLTSNLFGLPRTTPTSPRRHLNTISHSSAILI